MLKPKSNYQVGIYAITTEGKVVLVTTRSGEYWIFPKGKIEKGRCDREVASEEAYEEAGLIGEVEDSYQEFKTPYGKFPRLRLYRMRVRQLLESWPEQDERDRCVVSTQEADSLLQNDLRYVHRRLCQYKVA